MRHLHPLLATLTLAAALCACADAGTPSGPSSPSATGSDIPIEELLRNPGDDEDDRMNLALYALAGSLVDAAEDASILEAVFEEAGRSPGREVSFAAIAERSEGFEPLIDGSLERQAEQNPRIRELGTSLAAVELQMTVRGVDYYPNLYVPNLDHADLSLPPIIVVGSEVSDLDEVPGWNLEGGTGETVLLTEEEALASSAPVIVVNNATHHVETAEGMGGRAYAAAAPASPAGPVMQTSATSRNYYWSQYRINAGYHYESNSSKADLRFKLTFHNSGGGYLWWHDYQSGEYEATIDKISKSQSDANTLFNSLRSLTPGYVDVSVTNTWPLLYVSTFEYDWYATGKSVWSCGNLASVGNFRHYPKMKYSNEWYAVICGVNTGSVLPNVGSTYSFSTGKAFFTIYRYM